MAQTRQLAAIMFTDIVGYTAIMGKDEVAGMDLLKKNRQLHQSSIKAHQGRLLQEIGDGMLASFLSVSDAIDAAQEILKKCQNVESLNLRIGINLGEVVFENNDIFGDGVNIAARIEALAPTGGILISESVYDNIRNKTNYHAEFLFEKSLKNVDHTVKLYQIKSNATNKPTAVITPNSLAVLPFVNMSNDPDQEYFCEGISEEIINTIVQIHEIKVAGRTSSFSFKGKSLDLRSVGDQLGVSKILEGSVRKSGNRVRITAQLIEVSSGFHLWSNKYDRELDDIFQIQDDISLEISKQLQKTIIGEKSLPKPREQTQSVDAYELYLKGRSIYYRRGKALYEALECFKQALKIDPEYALASSGLAETYIMLSFHGYLHPKKCWAEALPAADSALRHGPDLGETHNTLAIIALLHDRDRKKSEKEFLKALEINPNHLQARCWYGLFYLVIANNDYENGINELKKAMENDPLSSYAIGMYSLAISMNGRFQEAIALMERAVEIDPKSWFSNFTLGICLLWGDEITRSIEVHKRGLEISDHHTWQLDQLLQTYLKAGKRDLAKKVYDEMDEHYEQQYLSPSVLAMSAAAMGDSDKALKLSQEAFDIIDPYLTNIITNWPPAVALRTLAGFEDIVRQFGYGTAGS